MPQKRQMSYKKRRLYRDSNSDLGIQSPRTGANHYTIEPAKNAVATKKDKTQLDLEKKTYVLE